MKKNTANKNTTWKLKKEIFLLLNAAYSCDYS